MTAVSVGRILVRTAREEMEFIGIVFLWRILGEMCCSRVPVVIALLRVQLLAPLGRMVVEPERIVGRPLGSLSQKISRRCISAASTIA
jgi:hypothetical protein